MWTVSTSQTAAILACWLARMAIEVPWEYAPRLPPTPMAASLRPLRRRRLFCASAWEPDQTKGMLIAAPATAVCLKKSRRVDFIDGLSRN
jgi:hypothetical protein